MAYKRVQNTGAGVGLQPERPIPLILQPHNRQPRRVFEKLDASQPHSRE